MQEKTSSELGRTEGSPGILLISTELSFEQSSLAVSRGRWLWSVRVTPACKSVYLTELYAWSSLSESNCLNKTLTALLEASLVLLLFLLLLIGCFDRGLGAQKCHKREGSTKYMLYYALQICTRERIASTYSFFWATETKILSRHFLMNTPCNKGSSRWAFHKWDPGRAETPTRKSAK